MSNWVDTGASPAPVALSSSASHFSRLFPRYVDEIQSRMRGLKVAWYAVDNEGTITAGPYPNRDECIARISQIPERLRGPDLWRRPDLLQAQRAS
jgi:hypothetical protein